MKEVTHNIKLSTCSGKYIISFKGHKNRGYVSSINAPSQDREKTVITRLTY